MIFSIFSAWAQKFKFLYTKGSWHLRIPPLFINSLGSYLTKFSKDLMKRQNISSAESQVFSLGWWEWCNCNIFVCSWSICRCRVYASWCLVWWGYWCMPGPATPRTSTWCAWHSSPHTKEVRWQTLRVVLCSSIQWLIIWYSPLPAWCSVVWTLS